MASDSSRCRCSWSLRPKSPSELVAHLRTAGISAIQLALDPLRRGHWPVEETEKELEEAGIEIRSGMMEMTGEDYSTLDSIRRIQR